MRQLMLGVAASALVLACGLTPAHAQELPGAFIILQPIEDAAGAPEAVTETTEQGGMVEQGTTGQGGMGQGGGQGGMMGQGG